MLGDLKKSQIFTKVLRIRKNLQKAQKNWKKLNKVGFANSFFLILELINYQKSQWKLCEKHIFTDDAHKSSSFNNLKVESFNRYPQYKKTFW